jgi:uncharacterized delta-60 repeat protein
MTPPQPNASFTFLLLLAVVAGLGFPTSSHGQSNPGDLDESFGAGGIVAITYAGTENAFFDVLLQEDGKIVLPGTIVGFQAVVRLNSDGSTDLDFGTQGAAGVATGASRAGALLDDGRIVVAGRAGAHMGVTRFLPSGMRDSAFGNDGVATVSVPGSNSVAYDIVRLEDNSMIVTGVANSSGNIWGVAARINANGTLDTSFGTNGLFQYALDGAEAQLRSITRFGDDQVVLAGLVRSSGEVPIGEMLLIRLGLNGEPDDSFGPDGVKRLDFTPGLDAILSVRTDNEGRLVASGTASRNFAAIRLDASDNPDQTFGTGGIATVGTVDAEEARQIMVQNDGRIVLAGFARAENLTSRFAAVRMLANGELDTSFGNNGTAVYALAQPASLAMGAALQNDGRIVIAGWTGNTALTAYQPVAIRILSDGTVDTEPVPADASPLALSVFPNPLASQGSVDFSLAGAGRARLAVYDLLGREIAVLHEGPASSGTSRVSFDASRLAPGSYVLRLVADGSATARSITVVR